MSISHDETGDTGPPVNRPLVILVVDDDRLVREVATRSLERAGYDVIAVESGQEAVDLVRAAQHSIDAVLLDLSMPLMDGWQTAALLKACRPDLPIALTSGYGEDQFPDRADPGTYDAFLNKPYGPRELAGCVEALMAAAARG
jgi:two-component system cell cycle sensor histidine kinase/response regulator CckA